MKLEELYKKKLIKQQISYKKEELRKLGEEIDKFDPNDKQEVSMDNLKTLEKSLKQKVKELKSEIEAVKKET